MPRTAQLLSNVFFDTKDNEEPRSRKSVASVPDSYYSSPHRLSTATTESEDDTKTGDIVNIIHDANMDGVRHLKDQNTTIRYAWGAVIALFIFLALFQIGKQVTHYYRNPIATSIEAEYPSKIAFPTVAICNNNQFRLSFIAGSSFSKPPKDEEHLNRTIFESALRGASNWDAKKFLEKAAHKPDRMILGCKWPNGTRCLLKDFKPVWTMTGLCYAINTDPMTPFEVTGSGSGHALRLTLNVESYERIEACTKNFRSRSLPGVKILIYNQSDLPVISLSGVNVPAGFSMDIPFKMQHRHKLPGYSCVEEGEDEQEAANNFSDPKNIRTCMQRKYLTSIEEKCGCSFGKPFDPAESNSERSYSNLPFCKVKEYFECVKGQIEKVRTAGSVGEEGETCLPACRSIEFTAWQDMNRLPRNLMPPIIDEEEEDDESDVEENDQLWLNDNETDYFRCDSDNRYLKDNQVKYIKRSAHRAFEYQSRYQEDLKGRTSRMIARLNNAHEKIRARKWGWDEGDLVVPFERLKQNSTCFRELVEGEKSIASTMNRPPYPNEEMRTKQMHALVDERSYKRDPERFKTLGALKEHYGSKVEEMQRDTNLVLSTIEKLWSLFDASTFSSKISADLARMDRIFALTAQYEKGELARRVFAEKMQSRQMRHFFEEEFMEGWAAPITRDIDQILLKTINELEISWPSLAQSLESGNAANIGASLFLGGSTVENKKNFGRITRRMMKCASGEVKDHAQDILKEFKKVMREYQSAYNSLFKKELPDYLELYEFGEKFESDNFAMVNIFLHQMHLEHWIQTSTYTFWSLACDVGGALGLFVGASLLTLIEIVYLCFKYGVCSKKSTVKEAITWVREASIRRRQGPVERFRNRMARPVFRPETQAFLDNPSSSQRSSTITPLPSPQQGYDYDAAQKRNIWSGGRDRTPPPFETILEENSQMSDPVTDSFSETHALFAPSSNGARPPPPKHSFV